jgi:hypothetical protein
MPLTGDILFAMESPEARPVKRDVKAEIKIKSTYFFISYPQMFKPELSDSYYLHKKIDGVYRRSYI